MNAGKLSGGSNFTANTGSEQSLMLSEVYMMTECAENFEVMKL